MDAGPRPGGGERLPRREAQREYRGIPNPLSGMLVSGPREVIATSRIDEKSKDKPREKKRCVILRSTPAPACETRCPLPEARIPNRRLSNNSRPGRITNRTHMPRPGTQRSTRAASKPTVPAPPSLYLALGNIPTQPGRHPPAPQVPRPSQTGKSKYRRHPDDIIAGI